MPSPDKFPCRDVQRSFRKFSDLVNDLLSSKYQTWNDALTHLLSHCETDPVMQVVMSPLKTDSRVDAKKWWQDAVSSVQGTVGSGHYSLPLDDDKRTALLYQILLLVNSGDADLIEFSISVYGLTECQDMVDTFNHEIVRKVTREVSYRMDEVAVGIGDEFEVSRDSIVVFHHHDYSTTITGSIRGSNVATGSASLSHSSVSIGSPAEMASALRGFKSLASDCARINRKTIETLLDLLAAQAESEDGKPDEVAECVRAIAEISPTIRSRMLGLVSGVSTSVAGSVIVEGIKRAFGM